MSLVLQRLRDEVGCSVKVYLNPKSEISEVPIKRFYRYVFEPQLQFDEDGNVRVCFLLRALYE